MKGNDDILRRVLLLMSYDLSHTSTENQQLLEQTIGNQFPGVYKPEADRIEKQTHSSRENIIKRAGGAENYESLIGLSYTGDTKPEPPTRETVVSAAGNYPSEASVKWTLPYVSPRAKKMFCNRKECFCGPYNISCRYAGASKDMLRVYKQDFVDWDNRIPSVFQEFGEWFSDPHVFLPAAAIIIAIASGGSLAGILLPAFLDAADIALYVKDKNYAAAGIGSAFMLIPGAQLARRIPAVKNFTDVELKTFLSKINKAVKLTKKEKELADAIAEQKLNLQWDILINSNKTILNKMLMQYTGKKLVLVALYLTKMGLLPWRVGINLAAAGGAFCTFMALGKKLGIAIEGLDYRNVKVPEQLANADNKKIEAELETKSTAIREVVKTQAIKIIEASDMQKSTDSLNAMNAADKFLAEIDATNAKQ